MIKSFLMLGQSNMAGRGFLNEADPIYNEKIKMLRNGQWQMMTEP
ncbi:sialate O-acetylesterase, partial [Bacillus velezensis]